MPDGTLVDIYLDRLASALPLPETERAAAVEEIAAYLADATAALVERGVPREAAQRQALERLGAPERLAGDLAAAHRQPRHLLEAAGTAVAVTLGTAFRGVVGAGALILLVTLIFGLALAAVRKVVGPQLLAMDWSPLLDGLLPAVVGAVTAYAVGRAVVSPVSLAARRAPEQVRPVALVVGGVLMTLIGLTAIEAHWTAPTALLMAALPVWFALGVLRPDLVPRWFPGSRWMATVVLGLLVVGLGMTLALGGIGIYIRRGEAHRRRRSREGVRAHRPLCEPGTSTHHVGRRHIVRWPIRGRRSDHFRAHRHDQLVHRPR